MTDLVNHPPHYTSHPSGKECIEFSEHLGFCLGNALKYLWRAGLKGSEAQDLEKAKWYLRRELSHGYKRVATVTLFAEEDIRRVVQAYPRPVSRALENLFQAAERTGEVRTWYLWQALEALEYD